MEDRRRPTGRRGRAPVTAHNGNGRPSQSPNFGDRLTEAVARRESQIVLGIDPDPSKLWPAAVEATSEARARLASTLSEAEDAAGGVGDAIERPKCRGRRLTTRDGRGGACALPRADRRGGAGVCRGQAAARLLRAPRRSGLARARARLRARPRARPARARRRQARRRPRHRGGLRAGAGGQHAVAVRPVSGLSADAFTANPLLGRDALEPLITTARAHVAPGVFVLVRTSNPGAADILDVELATGERLWERLATARRRTGTSRARPGSTTSAPSPARPSPSTSRGCAS